MRRVKSLLKGMMAATIVGGAACARPNALRDSADDISLDDVEKISI